MQPIDRRVRSMVAWLVTAALCGLIGFLVVYHYAAHERPSEHFAIVIDAGSTQTRSSLYHITVQVPKLAEWSQRVVEKFASFQDNDESEQDHQIDSSEEFNFPLSNLLQVRQVSKCVNGGPLAAISSTAEANELLRACLTKFTNHIKLLDFVGSETTALTSNTSEDVLDADEVNRQLALTDHRVNSVTHLYLGATAGMRALEQLNETRAREKVHWIEEAAMRSNELLLPPGSPFVNTGFVGIIKGSDEATFGWISVNFICDTIQVQTAPFIEQNNTASETGYLLDSGLKALNHVKQQLNSIGMLELGGASAQMAFQVPANQLGSEEIRNMSLQQDDLSLFNGQYRLATRSDLCLGMSQAVLRLNYIVLHRKFINRSSSQTALTTLKLENPCIQRGAQIKLTGAELTKLWRGACLVANSKLDPLRTDVDTAFRAHITSLKSLEFFGTGDASQCDLLLNDLIDPTSCKRYFSLCPINKNLKSPPNSMPFVTISGYNHALNVLDLVESSNKTNQRESAAKLSERISNKLGGNSINYHQFVNKTYEFCSTHASELLLKYPKVNKDFRDIICLQLVYIKKLLTEFYRFDPATSWAQIKFLIFTPKSVPSQFYALKKTGLSETKQIKLDVRRDTGWTLGFLLNATSYQLSGDDVDQIYFHHGASIVFIIRATILLMVACCLVAIAILVAGVAEMRQTESHRDGYISHSSSSSSYDVSYLSPTGGRGLPSMNTNSKPTGLKYVLSN